MAKPEEEKKTRIKRTFIKIMMDKVDARAKDFKTAQLSEIRKKIEDDLTVFEKILAESKKASKKNKQRFNKLRSYTKKELQEYINSLPN